MYLCCVDSNNAAAGIIMFFVQVTVQLTVTILAAFVAVCTVMLLKPYKLRSVRRCTNAMVVLCLNLRVRVAAGQRVGRGAHDRNFLNDIRRDGGLPAAECD
jgi:hypothetical protein